MNRLTLLLVCLVAALGGAGLPADFADEQARLSSLLTARASGLGFAEVADLRQFDADPATANAV